MAMFSSFLFRCSSSYIDYRINPAVLRLSACYVQHRNLYHHCRCPCNIRDNHENNGCGATSEGLCIKTNASQHPSRRHFFFQSSSSSPLLASALKTVSHDGKNYTHYSKKHPFKRPRFTKAHVSRLYTSSSISSNSGSNSSISSRDKSAELLMLPSEAGKRAHRLRCEEQQKLWTSLQHSMDTLLSHAGLQGEDRENASSLSSKSFNEPLCPPLHLETTYTRPPSGDYFNSNDGGNGWVYARMGNPTRKLLEDCIGSMELLPSSGRSCWDSSSCLPHQEKKKMEQVISSLDTKDCSKGTTASCAFSSGMAAVAAILLALPQPLHVLLPNDVYHGVPTQLKTMFVQRNVTYSNIDMTNLMTVENAIQEYFQSLVDEKKGGDGVGSGGGGGGDTFACKDPHLLVWMESPSNPQCKVVDIRAICNIVSNLADDRGTTNVTTVVDSTWAPPPITQPLLLGADIAIHSGTKYLAGHSDVLLGVVTTSPYTVRGKALASSIRAIQTALGSTASPFDCWLTLRGLRTLHLRIDRQSKTAMRLASFLDGHELVEKVHYPGLASHPQHDVASRQMRGGLYGGMLSFEMKNEAMAMAVAGAVSVIKRATSLGGTETLIEHIASIEPEDGRVSPEGLLRISVGLEDFEDLKEDLSRALGIAQRALGSMQNDNSNRK